MQNKNVISLLAIAAAIAGFLVLGISKQSQISYGFVNTEKLLESFVESNRAMEEIRAEEKKWVESRTIIEDSLKAFEQRVSLIYDTASVKKKTELKDEQVRRIEELGRFNQSYSNRIQNMRVEKLGSIYQKINTAMNDYAREKGLDVVFASSNGSIVYGDGSKADITADFLVFLNKRFK
ncbi:MULTISPECIES: OmpH family outer membrane protein [unclassified Fibrobacter]|uniref:OmpH family outer membrane protein n=1 Tax=unclassified Fibrobacter TaxID=2634177 RepID=UPI000D7B1E28|nr:MULTISPECIES: OmpH family outer membrane protein [unclassified Fibrobacter]PWJ61117.1 periplasmic chaperone for outer membrane proteins Skp [Fibrobacter sp. UWR4]PZW65575.1 periplasmic chaperone for outer membrane proteins Skp [Fibrobacter sp. UWR1]